MANPIGRRIRQAREDYGMSQTVLATRLGISRQHLNNIEHERSMPQPPLITKIAQILKVSTDYLHGLTTTEDTQVLAQDLLLSSEGDRGNGATTRRTDCRPGGPAART